MLSSGIQIMLFIPIRNSSVSSGVYETGLSGFGYDVALGVNQPQGVVNWLYFIRYVVPIIEYALMIVILYFMNLEEKLPTIKAELEKAGIYDIQKEAQAQLDAYLAGN